MQRVSQAPHPDYSYDSLGRVRLHTRHGSPQVRHQQEQQRVGIDNNAQPAVWYAVDLAFGFCGICFFTLSNVTGQATIRSMPNLNELRNGLTEQQRALLDQIWNCYLLGNEWPVAWDIHHPHRKAGVRETLKQLGSSCVHEFHDGQVGSRYQLTLQGILLTTEGKKMEDLLLRYLEYVRRRYQSQPKNRIISSAEAQGKLGLDNEQTGLLGRLVLNGNLYSQSASGGPNWPSNWSVGILREVEDFPSEGTLWPELQKLANRGFRDDQPVLLSDREPFHSASSLLAASTEPKAAYVPNTAFILMWMDRSRPELEDVSNAIKEVCAEFDVNAVRADDVEHQDKITDLILEQIKKSEFIIADLTGERPNVYYEVGYAHCFGKRPILYRKQGTNLHFDLSVHNVPEYQNITDLKALLRKRLEALLGRQASPLTKKPKSQG